MKKQLIWLSACSIAGAALAVSSLQPAVPDYKAPAKAEESKDYTSLITNPSFEGDDTSTLTAYTAANQHRGWTVTAPKGWTITGSPNVTVIVDADCYTDNNFGKVTSVADGSQALYLRMGWETGSTTLSQTLKLPAGDYIFSAMVRTAYANSASSTFSLEAADASVSDSFETGSTDCFVTRQWKKVSVNFNNPAEGNVTLALNVNWLSGGSCIMIDNVTLTEGEPVVVTPDPTEADVTSPTEGVITHDFVAEAQMQSDIMQMLADFTKYMKNNFQECTSPNSIGEACGSFKAEGNNTMANNEQGVRPNADMSMICAFLVKYGKDKVTLPAGVTWTDVEDMARKSLIFSYSTHKANKLKVCSGNNYWGSVSNSDHVWESSLWAMSVAYSAFFQWDKLSQAQKDYIKAMMVAECEYELQRGIPTGYNGDTKAEENGWEADILAATLGLFPTHEKADKWFERLREFAINSYSHVDDASDATVIDPEYNNKTVADLYKGKNLYDDYTLQNHNLFHTSYQNVVMQELGEAALALKLFQTELHGTEKWKTNALMHNNQKVMDEVLNWLALADGELAMPNGNDWSLFLFDQITSYSTMACFLSDPNALMLENMAYKYIQARQKTTSDGSWLLNADVGPRRMGVEGHRVMMTWLMHHAMSTAALTPTTWGDFNKNYSEARVLTAQNVVRASTPDRFTCFSWSSGLKSYTGYFAPNTPDNNKIIVPYRANNTGNLIGWYEVDGKGNGATPGASAVYELDGNAYVMNGELNTNGESLNNRFALYSTPGNALIYTDYVRANADVTVKRELGGLLAISTDPFMKETRTLYYGDGKHKQSDGKSFVTLTSDWVNVDNALGMVVPGDKKIGFGDRSLNNSIYTAKLYLSYSPDSRTAKAGQVLDRRNIIYYSNIDAAKTKELAGATIELTTLVPEGWNGVLAPDTDGSYALLLANFASETACALSGVTTPLGAPVFTIATTIDADKSAARFIAEQHRSFAQPVKVFLKGSALTAMVDPEDNAAAYVTNNGASAADVEVSIATDNGTVSGKVRIDSKKCVRIYVANGKIASDEATMPSTGDEDPAEGFYDITSRFVKNPGFENDLTYSKEGSGKVSAGTFDPCYVNTIDPLNADYPNILPVDGWNNESKMSGASPYCRMYSMPYSSTMFCVSEVGNYAAQCAPYLKDENRGARVLTVLNSWSSGSNAIAQTVTLPAGEYRMLINMRYECPSGAAPVGNKVEASGNTNTSLTGYSFDNVTEYFYPSQPNAWETVVRDFTLTRTTPVKFSIGYSASASTGAANNTLLYADNFRLLSKEQVSVSELVAGESATAPVYSVSGIEVSSDLNTLTPGVYIRGDRKILVK